MATKLPLAREHEIQQVIMNYLRYKGWYVSRMNSGQYAVGEGRNRRFIMGQDKGTPDIMAFKPCNHNKTDNVELLFVEVKRPGNKPTALQNAKMRQLEEFGAVCIVATSIENLEAQL